MAEAAGRCATTVLHQQNSLPRRTDEREGQVRNARIGDNQADLRRRDFLRAVDENAAVRHRVIRNCHRRPVGDVSRDDRRGNQFGNDIYILGGEAGVIQSNVIESRRQRRPGGDGIARKQSRRKSARETIRQVGFLVKAGERRRCAEFFKHLNEVVRRRGWGCVRGRQDEFHVTHRHVNVIIKPTERWNGDIDAVTEVLVRRNGQTVVRHVACLRRRIVHFGQHPHADGPRADEIQQTAGTVAGTAGDVRKIVINKTVRPRRTAERIVVVQHVPDAVVGERADEIAVILMHNRIAHGHLARLHRIQRQPENVSDARMRRTAVRDADWHGDAVDELIAVLILTERYRGEHGQKIVFRRHPVLRIHADVIDLAGRGIRVHDELRAAGAQRRAIEDAGHRQSDLRAVEAVGNGDRIKRQQI